MQDALYRFVLTFHGTFRWIVMLVAVSTVAAIYKRPYFERRWPSSVRRLSSLFVGAIDIQLFLGFVLYFGLSPITKTAFHDTRFLTNREAVFFGVFHISVMLLAVFFAHLGNITLRRPDTGSSKHRAAALFTLTFALLVTATPWWRPLIR